MEGITGKSAFFVYDGLLLKGGVLIVVVVVLGWEDGCDCGGLERGWGRRV